MRYFFPLVPLSKSIQEIQWTPMVLQNLGEGGWAGYMAIANLLIFVRWAFFQRYCGGEIAVCWDF